jgi:hypothetical protein
MYLSNYVTYLLKLPTQIGLHAKWDQTNLTSSLKGFFNLIPYFLSFCSSKQPSPSTSFGQISDVNFIYYLHNLVARIHCYFYLNYRGAFHHGFIGLKNIFRLTLSTKILSFYI